MGRIKSLKTRYKIGIDEVGRGCLAGPVTVCAVLLKKGRRLGRKDLGPLRDSKKLSPERRTAWYKYFKDISLAYAVSSVAPGVVDKINITAAANLAAERSLKKVLRSAGIEENEVKIFLDGSLYLRNKKESLGRAKTVVKGDEKIKAISAASVIAKVIRDRRMARLAKEFPGYRWEINKGYGTKAHLAAIKGLGISKMHRKTFMD